MYASTMPRGPNYNERFPLEPIPTRISTYAAKLGPNFKPAVSLHKPDQGYTLKDITSRLDVNQLAEVQSIDKTRYRKIADDDNALQQIGAFNGNRHWNRQLVEYLDHKDPLAVWQFVHQFPKGASTWQTKKRKRTPYVRKTEPKELPPVTSIRCCKNDCIQENLSPCHLQQLRDDYLKCSTAQEKRDFLKELLEAETKNFSIHGQHLS